jgi:hypothetical protein
MAQPVQKNRKMYYTQKEVAEEFRVSQGTVIKWRSLGYLEYFKPPGSNRVLYPVEGIERFSKQFIFREEVIKSQPVAGINYRHAAPNTNWRI